MAFLLVVFNFPQFNASYGLLGTTFGGNHLACTAAIAVLDIMKDEGLIDNATSIGNYLMDGIRQIGGYKELRGRGLMIGIDYDFPVDSLRKTLLFEHKQFTGVAGKTTIRLLPSLAIGVDEADMFLEALRVCVNTERKQRFDSAPREMNDNQITEFIIGCAINECASSCRPWIAGVGLRSVYLL